MTNGDRGGGGGGGGGGQNPIFFDDVIVEWPLRGIKFYVISLEVGYQPRI